MRRTIVLILVAALVMGLGAFPAYGDFYVISMPAGVGTRINSLPYEITEPGFYYLTKDLLSSGSGIRVRSPDVTIDLMGFTINGTAKSGYGIYIGSSISGMHNVEIRNGTIRNFYEGICAGFETEVNDRIINIRAHDNDFAGIYLFGNGHMVKGCTASNNTTYGIRCRNSLVIQNVARGNGTNLSATGTLGDNYAP